MDITKNSSSLETYVPIADFYTGKSIFLTGGMGFVGEVLVEKFLYSCPDIRNIYMLVREKKGISPQDRLKIFLATPVFFRLTKERPESLEKVKIVSGDLTLVDLGISANDLKVLKEEVSVVFHVAATVKFNEPLYVALKVNVEGTDEVLKISRNMNKIEVFVYMSTIFANTNEEIKIIEEKLYPCPKPLDEVYGMIDKYGKNEVFTPEKLVTSAIKEPVKGWISNKDHYTLDIIPVDYVVNLTIIAAARYNSSKKIEIYNSCSSYVNPLSLKDNAVYLLKESRRQKFHDLPFPGITYTTSEWLLTLRRITLEILPAYLADIILYVTRKPVRYADTFCVSFFCPVCQVDIRFLKIQRRLAASTSAIKYFTSQNWLMTMTNSLALYRSLNGKDQNTFPCDPSDINWEEYLATYFNGIRQYLLKEHRIPHVSKL